MKPSNEGSRKFDIIVDFVSYKKGKEKGLIVDSADGKDNTLLECIEFSAGNSELLENGKLKKEDGNIIVNFADYKQAKENNESRITEFALEKKKRNAKSNEGIAL